MCATRPPSRMQFMKTSNMLALAGLVALGVAAAEVVTVPGIGITFEAPKTLRALSAPQIKTTFQGQGAPQSVFLTDDQKVVMSFEWRGAALKRDELIALDSQFAKVIQSKSPKSFTHGLRMINGTQWAQFVFVVPGKAGDVRNEMLVTSYKGRMLVVNLNSTVADYTRNQTTALNMTNSLSLD